MLSQSVYCPICSNSLTVRLAHGRKSGKHFIMLICAQDGRHFRAFITHQPYVKKVMDNLESHQEIPSRGTR